MKSNVSNLLARPLDDLSHEDRRQLLSALLVRCLGNNALLVDPLPDHAMLIFGATGVGPGQRANLAVRSYQSFQATRLVVLDLEREVTDTEETVSRTTTETLTGRWWWKRKTVATAIDKVVTTRCQRSVPTPAAVWDLHEMFSGSMNVMPAAVRWPLSLSALSPGNVAPLQPFQVHAGVDVIISISHRLETSAPFQAVLIGKVNSPDPGGPWLRPPGRGSAVGEDE